MFDHLINESVFLGLHRAHDPVAINILLDLLDGDCPTVNGKSLRENVSDAKIWNGEVIRSRENPISPEGGTAVLRGNLCPNGAVIKHSAMEPRFLQHRGPAVVFKSYPDLAKRLDDPALSITADSVMVLQNAGPIGAPGMEVPGQPDEVYDVIAFDAAGRHATYMRFRGGAPA